MQNPVRGFLHGGAAVASLVGLVVLLAAHRGGWTAGVALAVYGGSLVAMYTVSALYHSLPWGPAWKERMRRVDHSLIFLVVAGTYTPIAAIVLDGPWRSVSLTVVWGVAIVGIVLKFLRRSVSTGLSVTLQMVMGWGAILPMWEVGRRLGLEPVLLVFAGGLCYTVGMIFFATKRPRLFPRVFSYHEAFHVLVVAGSLLHFLVVVRHVLPYA